MHLKAYLALLSLSAFSAAQSIDEVTEVSNCHAHGDTQYCFAAGEDLEVLGNVDPDVAPDSYSGCHAHGEELCVRVPTKTLHKT